jgi:hypothetical protein
MILQLFLHLGARGAPPADAELEEAAGRHGAILYVVGAARMSVRARA